MNRPEQFPKEYRDSLTDLPNRLAIHEQLEIAIQKTPGKFALLELDVEGLKELNDTEGHNEGDRFLRAIAEVLSEILRSNDRYLPAHKSGDEFSIILYDLENDEQVAAVCERIRTILDDLGINIAIGGRVHRLGESGEQLSEAADALMYQDKIHRKIELYNDPVTKQAIYAIYHTALAHNINLRDLPLLAELVQKGSL